MNLEAIRQRDAEVIALPAADGHYYSTEAQAIVDRRDLLAEVDRLRAALDAHHPTGSRCLFLAGESCRAVIHHGPGHQSTTGCELTGPHDVHRAVIGEFNQVATWRGDRGTTGFFDQAPEAD